MALTCDQWAVGVRASPPVVGSAPEAVAPPARSDRQAPDAAQEAHPGTAPAAGARVVPDR
ncbi:hypothetical protein MLAC_13570 [Mycobacterium lacus]|uniref:Uncharacterized protein n=1 Tax=Mycobacterium lacus TaxID=169765 RepID=A0A7I7NIG5_9MYCO|nr:hypothetical protein MLAC_13570 [Mycobacterium lacus]